MARKKDRPADPVARERARVLDACERLGLDLGVDQRRVAGA